MSKLPLSYEELAALYDKHSGDRTGRTVSVYEVERWAADQVGKLITLNFRDMKYYHIEEGEIASLTGKVNKLRRVLIQIDDAIDVLSSRDFDGLDLYDILGLLEDAGNMLEKLIGKG